MVIALVFQSLGFRFKKEFNGRTEVVQREDRGYFIGLSDDSDFLGPLSICDLGGLANLIEHVLSTGKDNSLILEDGRKLCFTVSRHEEGTYFVLSTTDFTLGHTKTDAEKLLAGIYGIFDSFKPVNAEHRKTFIDPLTENPPMILPGRVGPLGFPLRLDLLRSRPGFPVYTGDPWGIGLDGVSPIYDVYGRTPPYVP